MFEPTKRTHRDAVEAAMEPRDAGEQAVVGDLLEVRELVELIVKALVDFPEQVHCHEVEGSHSCVLELEVAKEDVGKVIGKHGVHADAIRRLVNAIGGKKKRRYVLEILEDV